MKQKQSEDLAIVRVIDLVGNGFHLRGKQVKGEIHKELKFIREWGESVCIMIFCIVVMVVMVVTIRWGTGVNRRLYG